VRLDRIADDIYVLMSDSYAQVTSTVLTTPAGAIIIDTMPFPADAKQVLAFVESKLGPHSVRYVIMTHHHADHVYGTYLFSDALVIAQDECRRSLARYGQAQLDRAKRETPALAPVHLRLPDMTFLRELHLHLSHRHLHLFHTPGHSPDAIGIHIPEEKAVIAGDTVMPVPYIAGGSHAQLRSSLLAIRALKPSFVVQGHGDVLLRGEVNETIDSSVAYLDAIVEKVRQIVDRGQPASKLKAIDIEDCGKSRIPLDGLVAKLHLENLVTLYREFAKPKGEGQTTVV
jgi:cyclase